MSDLHVYCLDVRQSPAGAGLDLQLRIVETEGVVVDALLLRHEVMPDPFSVCAPRQEEEELLERLAVLDVPEGEDGPIYRLCEGAVVVRAFAATIATAIEITCGAGDPIAESMDVISAGVIPLTLRFRADAFVTDADGPRLVTGVLDQERSVHVPVDLWRGARSLAAAERIIDLAEVALPADALAS
jgi:hypothetical protein